MRIIETISTACSVGEKKQTNIIFIFFIVIIILLTAYWFRVTRCADHPSRDLARDHSRTQAAACRLTPLPSLSPRRPLLPLESHLTVTRSSTVCRPATMTHEQRNIIKKNLGRLQVRGNVSKLGQGRRSGRLNGSFRRTRIERTRQYSNVAPA